MRVPHPVQAQTSLEVKLEQAANSKPKITSLSGLTTQKGAFTKVNLPGEITVTCTPPLDPTKVSVQLSVAQKGALANTVFDLYRKIAGPINPPVFLLDKAAFTPAALLKLKNNEAQVLILYDKKEVAAASITFVENEEQALLAPRVAAGNPQVQLKDCPVGTITVPEILEKANNVSRPVFYVNTSGEVLVRPTLPIDENDQIIVRVVGGETELRGLKVTRKSAFRDATTLRILGASTPEGFRAEEPVSTDCKVKEVFLADFAPGKGEIQITPTNDASTFKGGTFDFTVNPLYAGAFSFGPAYSWLHDRTYGLTAKGTDQVITVTEKNSPRVNYIVSYTQYIWGKRDVAKYQTLRLYEHVNPMLGLTLNDVLNNAILGVSVDMLQNSVYFQGGVHLGRVTKLDPTSGLDVGSTFTLAADKIPTIKEWDREWFLGVAIDLRTAIKFFSAAATGVIPK